MFPNTHTHTYDGVIRLMDNSIRLQKYSYCGEFNGKLHFTPVMLDKEIGKYSCQKV